jgi:hypothetical protein
MRIAGTHAAKHTQPLVWHGAPAWSTLTWLSAELSQAQLTTHPPILKLSPTTSSRCPQPHPPPQAGAPPAPPMHPPAALGCSWAAQHPHPPAHPPAAAAAAHGSAGGVRGHCAASFCVLLARGQMYALQPDGLCSMTHPPLYPPRGERGGRTCGSQGLGVHRCARQFCAATPSSRKKKHLPPAASCSTQRTLGGGRGGGGGGWGGGFHRRPLPPTRPAGRTAATTHVPSNQIVLLTPA